MEPVSSATLYLVSSSVSSFAVQITTFILVWPSALAIWFNLMTILRTFYMNHYLVDCFAFSLSFISLFILTFVILDFILLFFIIFFII